MGVALSSCADSDERTSALSRREASEFFRDPMTLPRRGGHRESRMHAAPAVSCAKCTRKTHTSIQVQRRQSGFPCAVVYGLLRALSGERAFLPPSSLRSLLLTNLTPASRRQDHTTSPSAGSLRSSWRKRRVHRIPPRV